jgi:hypothetical protein
VQSFFYLFSMKYLNIHQSVLNKHDKYAYRNIYNLNSKYEFIKHWGVQNSNQEYKEQIFMTQDFIQLFKRYLNHDIYIYWQK